MGRFKRNEVIALLGAGASVDAGIPHSKSMINRVEGLIRNGNEWGEYEDLYNFVKSSIKYGEGVRGKFGEVINYNIERLVNTLEELNKKEDHPLYPFVGSWIPRLSEVSGSNFANISDLRDKIVERLRERWLEVEHDVDSEYYAALEDLQAQYEHPLRVFTLNYDLCVEENCDEEILERGFEDQKWDWQRFELDRENIYLYKLHGSTDWYREDGRLQYKNPNLIDDDEVEIIFGTTQKVQYVDPFLFFAYELRKWTLSHAKLIICIGYGFGDEHINSILGQALRQDERKRLLTVSPMSQGEKEVKKRILRSLNLTNSDQIECFPMTAEEFMLDHMDLEYLAEEVFPDEEPPFEEVTTTPSGTEPSTAVEASPDVDAARSDSAAS